MITPTIGRIVHYHARGNPNLEPLAAIVTKVWDDRLVNLCVFTISGSTNPLTCVVLVQPEDGNVPGEGHCEWMPYQVKKGTGSESGEKEAGTVDV